MTQTPSNPITDRRITIATAQSRTAKVWNNTELLWSELAEKLSTVRRTDETVNEYAKLSKDKQGRVKDVGGFVGGGLENGVRSKRTVMFRDLIALDIDHADKELLENIRVTAEYAYIVYSTHSHTPENMRVRMVIPLFRSVDPNEYVPISQRIAERVGLDKVDPASYKVEQLMYWPSAPKDGEFICFTGSGPLLDPDSILATYDDWHDQSQWPAHTNHENAVNGKEPQSKQRSDPRDKPGIIGAFCRAHSITNVLETILQEQYTPVSACEPSVPNRYTYTKGSSAGGLVVYDDLFSYSHHASDPSSGKLCNAFDLVRLHLFTPGVPDQNGKKLSKSESLQMMLDYASNDQSTRLHLIDFRKLDPKDEFQVLDEGDYDWLKYLEIEKGMIKPCLSNLLLIVQNDPTLKGIVFNEFTDTLEIIDSIAPVPWKHKDHLWRDVDDKKLITYIGTRYCHFALNLYDVVVSSVADDRSYHPVRDYLNSLPAWDQIPRVDSLLIDYLGAPDNAYIRAITRKALCAAVKRVMVPGIKFDTILVLSGAQGIGKSTLISKLGMQWFNDSLSLADTRDKTAAEKLQGFWILEIGELAGLRKTEVEVLRSFLSRQDDIYRVAFGKRVTHHLRQCIFIGTTNATDGYLRDTTGNRRFWPVDTSPNTQKHSWDLTSSEIDQIWAEVFYRVQQGESLILDRETEAMAQQAQRDAMEADDREGMIRQYLDTPLPEDWENRSTGERIQYLLQKGDYAVLDDKLTPGTVLRDTVCIKEIWCECFRKDPADWQRRDSNEIAQILIRLGWTRCQTLKNCPPYGMERCFERPRSIPVDSGKS